VESLPRPSEIIDMLNLNDIAVFVRVAQLCSFSRAEHPLGMLVSTVRPWVSLLEGHT
jgi:DNA-binding transcriptional LysR family regulator